MLHEALLCVFKFTNMTISTKRMWKTWIVAVVSLIENTVKILSFGIIRPSFAFKFLKYVHFK